MLPGAQGKKGHSGSSLSSQVPLPVADINYHSTVDTLSVEAPAAFYAESYK